jgi:methyl-accepting chemotaxis protein
MVSQQQQTSTEQVAQNVRAMAEVVRQAALPNTQTRASAEGLKAHADHLAELVRTFRLGE